CVTRRGPSATACGCYSVRAFGPACGVLLGAGLRPRLRTRVRRVSAARRSSSYPNTRTPGGSPGDHRLARVGRLSRCFHPRGHSADVDRLQSLGAFLDLEFHRLVFEQATPSLPVDLRIVYEHVGAVVLLDETPALLIVEPLHFTHRHWFLHFHKRDSASSQRARLLRRQPTDQLRRPSAGRVSVARERGQGPAWGAGIRTSPRNHLRPVARPATVRAI